MAIYQIQHSSRSSFPSRYLILELLPDPGFSQGAAAQECMYLGSYFQNPSFSESDCNRQTRTCSGSYPPKSRIASEQPPQVMDVLVSFSRQRSIKKLPVMNQNNKRSGKKRQKLLTTSMQRNSKAHRRRQNLVLMHRDCFAKMNRMQNRHQNSTILSARKQ